MKQPKIKFQKVLLVIISNVGILILLLSLTNRYLLLPNTNIDNTWVGWQTPTQAYKNIKSSQSTKQVFSLILKKNDQSYEINTDQLGVYSNTLAVIAQARKKQQADNLLNIIKIWWDSLRKPTFYASKLEPDKAKTLTLINEIAQKTDQPGKKPKLILQYSGKTNSLSLDPGVPGEKLDVEASVASIETSLALLDSTQITKPLEIELVSVPLYPQLDKTQQKEALGRARSLVGIYLQFVNQENHLKFTINDQDLISILDPNGEFDTKELDALLMEWAQTLDRPASSAIFEYNQEKQQVTKFEPDLPGIQLNIPDTKATVINFLKTTPPLSKEVDLQLTQTQPLIQLADTNNFGINQEIGYGESYYYHSIPSRVHNVGLAASIVQNIVIPPGNEFSFNKSLGEVSRATGFQPAYVIRSGKTELGDGGGVCQVSTTLFRAVLNAGLKITKRLPHSYRVSYYELDNKPGIDATVYAGDVDFRFINDTPNYILIHSSTDKDKLYMNYTIYGTSDGRTTQITDHQVWGYQPALPNEYIIDPNLPPGSSNQIDWSASGINARFTNVIKNKNGEIIREDQYTSHYKPWSAKFLIGPNP